MTEIAYFTIVGLCLGCGYTLVALGISTLYNGSGLLNFAQGDVTGEITRLRSTGIAILLVEHHLERVRALADAVVAMDQGVEFAGGSAAEVLDSTDVRERYLGEVIS